jgi:hypothetical protein
VREIFFLKVCFFLESVASTQRMVASAQRMVASTPLSHRASLTPVTVRRLNPVAERSRSPGIS